MNRGLPTRSAPALALALALALAGCLAPGALPLGPNASDEATAWALRAIPTGDKHDHYDLAQHKGLSTPNFEVVGWDPLLLASKGGQAAGGYFCGEVARTEDGRQIAVVNSLTSDVAFVVIDVTDPAMPVVLGEYLVKGSFAYDVALTPDGKHVIIANDPSLETGDYLPATANLPLALPGVALVQPQWRDACTGEVRNAGPEQQIPLGPATLMVGIEDPENPVLEDIFPAPVLGPHSVATAQVDDITFVVSSITNLVHPISYFQIFTVEDTPLGARLMHQSTYQTPQLEADERAIITGHVDASIEKHPVTNQTIAYLANWDAGMIVLDITDPRVPREISRFSEYDGEGSYMTGQESGNMHETYPIPGLWDGKHYVLAGQEILAKPADHPTGWVYILDATDPADIQLVGKWTLPVDIEWSHDLVFSTHYVAVVNGTMFVTMYHGGMWAVDISTPEKMLDPPTVGVFMPDRDSPNPPPSGGHGVEGAPDVLDVLPLPDGSMVVYDASTGIYVVRYDDTSPMAAPPTWAQAQAALS